VKSRGQKAMALQKKITANYELYGCSLSVPPAHRHAVAHGVAAEKTRRPLHGPCYRAWTRLSLELERVQTRRAA
jgi:hypothetical protein